MIDVGFVDVETVAEIGAVEKLCDGLAATKIKEEREDTVSVFRLKVLEDGAYLLKFTVLILEEERVGVLKVKFKSNEYAISLNIPLKFLFVWTTDSFTVESISVFLELLTLTDEEGNSVIVNIWSTTLVARTVDTVFVFDNCKCVVELELSLCIILLDLIWADRKDTLYICEIFIPLVVIESLVVALSFKNSIEVCVDLGGSKIVDLLTAVSLLIGT